MKLVAIVGPTGVGKSALALSLAAHFGGEIVSADSRQVYRHLDIGTDKPTAQERVAVPHHLIDVVDPDGEWSLALYQKQARDAVAAVDSRGKVPFLVGGSGLYVWALLEGWVVPAVAPDPALRQRLEERATQEGPQALYQELEAVDPAAAMRIDPRNARRTIRALEVVSATGLPFSQAQGVRRPPWRVLLVGLSGPRDELYRRIDLRVEGMLARGWRDEVAHLMTKYDLGLSCFSGLGYRELGASLRGQLELAEAVARIKFQTHRFVRHQSAWFRQDDPRIQWFPLDSAEEVRSVVECFLTDESESS